MLFFYKVCFNTKKSSTPLRIVLFLNRILTAFQGCFKMLLLNVFAHWQAVLFLHADVHVFEADEDGVVDAGQPRDVHSCLGDFAFQINLHTNGISSVSSQMRI